MASSWRPSSRVSDAADPNSSSSTSTRRKERWNPCSVVNPMPASTCWPWRAATRADRPASALAMAADAGDRSSQADCRAASAASTATSASANRWRTAWKELIGRPNWILWSACTRAWSSMLREAPTSSWPTASRHRATASGQSPASRSWRAVKGTSVPATSTSPRCGATPATGRRVRWAADTSTTTSFPPVLVATTTGEPSEPRAVVSPRTVRAAPSSVPGGPACPGGGRRTRPVRADGHPRP